MAEVEILDRLAKFRGNLGRFFDATVAEQDAKLVATESSDRVLLAQARLKYSGDLLQYFIPHGMPTGIVDNFKLVEIDVYKHVFA